MKIAVFKFIFLFLSIVQAAYLRTPEQILKELNSVEVQKATQDYDQFLRRLGFEDYSGMITESLKSHSLSYVSREVLKLNKERYQIFNQTRELSSKVVATLYATRSAKEKERALERVIEFTARMMALQPLDPPAEFPPEIQMAPKKDREDLVTDYIIKVTQQNFRHHLEAVESDLVEALFDGKRLKAVLQLGKNSGELPAGYKEVVSYVLSMGQTLGKILKFSYLDSEMGQTRYLGRALVASLLKYAHDTNNPQLVMKLKTKMHHMGYNMNDYIGDTLSFDDGGKKQSFKIKNGTFIMERSLGKEAGEITWGARPGWQNMSSAFSKSILGHFWAPFLPVEDEMELDTKSFIKEKAAEAKISQLGYSHVGIATVLEDAATGIKMVWALDNYPNSGEGGIRIIGIKEQFALKGPFIRFGFSTYDAKKFYKFAKEQISKRGYQKTAWVSDKEEFDKDGNSIEKNEYEKVEIPTLISEKEFTELHALGEVDVEQWYAAVMKRVTDNLRINKVVKDGIGFAYGFSNFACRGYCTFTVNLAALEAVGLDLQMYYDRWNMALPVLQKLNVESAQGLNTKQRILAPGGFAWQKNLVGQYGEVTYSMPNKFEKFRAVSRPFYIEKNTETTDLLRQLKHFSKLVGDLQSLTDADVSADEIGDSIRGEIRKRQKSGRVGVGRAGSHPGAGYLTTTCQRLLRFLDQ